MTPPLLCPTCYRTPKAHATLVPEDCPEVAHADTIAAHLGETSAIVRAQFRCLCAAIGTPAVALFCVAADGAIAEQLPSSLRQDGTPRTPGGVFFRLVRETLWRTKDKPLRRGLNVWERARKKIESQAAARAGEAA